MTACLCAVSVVAAGLVQAQSIDEVVLIVNDRAVTAIEFQSLAAIHQLNKPGFKPGQHYQPQLDSEPTDTIIHDLLLSARASNLSAAEVADSEAESAFERLAGQNRLSKAQFAAQLSGAGIDPSVFRQNLKTRLAVEQFITQRIAPRVAVSPGEVETFVDNNPALKEQIKTEYALEHVLVAEAKDTSNSEKKRLRALADSVHNSLASGESIASLLAKTPELKVSAENGDLGWKAESELPDLFVGAIKGLRRGQLADVVAGPNGYHLIRLKDKRGGVAGVEEYQVRHILKRVQKGQDDAAVKQQIMQLVDKLAAGASFESLAQAESEDPGSGAKGGALGWIKASDVVPEFSTAMVALPLNQLSEPVRSEFGYHLIEVLGKRVAKQAGSPAEQQARQVLFSQKLNEKIEDLVSDLRQMAYIEIVE